MTDTEKKATKTKLPKGGSKGGTRFPRLNMAEALGYSKKLVSKTFSGPQPEMTILVGVFDNKGPDGAVRASALKQYGLMDGNAKGYIGSELAKKIEAVVPEEKAALIRQSFLTPKLFKQMYDTLQPDKVTRAKVRQAAATGGVHPETLDLCVDCFIEGAVHAGLGAKTDDGVDLRQSTLAPPPPPADVDAEAKGNGETPEESAAAGAGTPPPPAPAVAQPGNEDALDRDAGAARPGKPVITVSLNVDPSSDPDKLEKQLKLLREFKLI